ncbi:cytochrome P450 [Amylostereum chailletii]|nr:cytochrome P450 [Amylostereum chailletii]
MSLFLLLFLLPLLLLPLLLLLAYVLYPLLPICLSLLLSPLSRLPSPPTPSYFLGNLSAIADQENNDVISAWTRTYGSTFTYRGFIRGRRLLTTDPAALNWILGHAYDFPKPEFVRASLAAMVAGDQGLLTVERDVHRRQNRAFTPTYIRSLLPVFWDKASQLRDLLLISVDSPAPPLHLTTPPSSPRTPHSPVDSFRLLRSLDPIRQTSPPPTPAIPDQKKHFPPSPPGVVVDILSWLARASLDVIGEAGFGYAFNALDSPDSAFESNTELYAAFATIFATARKFRVLSVLQSWFPLLRRYQPNGKSMADAQATIRRIGSQLIDERLTDVAPTTAAHPVVGSRDLLSVLVRANAADGPSGLSQSEIVSQISTFIAAGHETSSSALTWTLYALARAPAEQRALREALQGIPIAADPQATMDAVLAHPVLDRVVHESLRLHAPVSLTMRVYDGQDMETVVPLSRGVRVRAPQPLLARLGWRPLAGFLLGGAVYAAFGWAGVALCVGLGLGLLRWKRGTGGEDGELKEDEWTMQDHVRLRRGDIISIPIQAVNRDPAVWGDGAREFRPSRWLDPPTAMGSVSGLYPHTLTFLNGSPINGNRACIGYRFALAEIKIFLFLLVRSLEFSMDDGVVVEKRVKCVEGTRLAFHFPWIP